RWGRRPGWRRHRTIRHHRPTAPLPAAGPPPTTMLFLPERIACSSRAPSDMAFAWSFAGTAPWAGGPGTDQNPRLFEPAGCVVVTAVYDGDALWRFYTGWAPLPVPVSDGGFARSRLH